MSWELDETGREIALLLVTGAVRELLDDPNDVENATESARELEILCAQLDNPFWSIAEDIGTSYEVARLKRMVGGDEAVGA